ncbi:MAG TPA: Nramp family divalent metal transporter [Bacteroidota bacterium]|nr:Nramp family divalent metal transporter [Bacteroidota bacterium]
MSPQQVISEAVEKIVDTAQTVRKVRWREITPYVGPAFLVSVGYMDPGNWGTNIAGGSTFGYTLLWVLLVSNLMAILLQTMAARLGIVTGKSLAENCRLHYSKGTNFFLWIMAEAAMMATDIAEFLGAAIGFYILFGIPMFSAGLLTGVVVFLILGLYRFGYRSVEYVIISLVAIIGFAYVIEIFLAKPDWGQVATAMVVPRLSSESIFVAMGMLGATVMPHNLFLHSGIIQTRLTGEPTVVQKKKLFRFAVLDSVFALNMSWLVNSAMVVMSAAVFFANGIQVESIQDAHRTLEPLLGSLSSYAFAIALLAAGLSSSTTGTIAGQIVLEGFLDIKMSLWLRRFITMVPALIVIALGLNEIDVLVLSQVVLSMQLPFSIIPLIMFTMRKEIMGELRNGRLTNILAVASAVLVIGLNILLLYQFFGGTF